MKIDRLKKMSNGKYKLYLDNGESIITYDEVIINNNLLYKKELDNNLYNKLVIDNNYYDLYNKCLNQISHRLRSEKELREYLNKYTSDYKDINNIILKLKDIGLINDVTFTKAFISDKINLSNVGPIKIKNELLKHNIDEDVIAKEISKIDKDIVDDKINKYISKEVKHNKKYSAYYLRNKITNNLLSLGYSLDMINDKLANYEITDSIDIEYQKQYHKLIAKYSGIELVMKLKTKLYQKGFKKEEIENIIQKNMD